jgi:hypothetical protein
VCGSEVGGEAAVEADLEGDAGSVRRGKGPIDLVQGHAGGLLAEHRLSGLSGGHGQFGVSGRGGGDDDRVHGWIRNQGQGVVSGRCAVPISQLPGDIRSRVGDDSQPGPWYSFGDHLCMRGADPARADQPDRNVLTYHPDSFYQS